MVYSLNHIRWLLMAGNIRVSMLDLEALMKLIAMQEFSVNRFARA